MEIPALLIVRINNISKCSTDAVLPHFCNMSVINGAGYMIDNSAITVSSYYSRTHCEGHQARHMDNTDWIGWCSNTESRKYLESYHGHLMIYSIIADHSICCLI